jgi:hypothetical protein
MANTAKPLGLNYRSSQFSTFINGLYSTPESMIATVKRLKRAKGAAFIKSMKWGDYQPHVAPEAQWPEQTRKQWDKSVLLARNDLTTQPNAQAVHRTIGVVPPHRCELLDAAVRLCFTSKLPGQSAPGIPITVKVLIKTTRDVSPEAHDIKLRWRYDPATQRPIRLYLTMVCPQGKV